MLVQKLQYIDVFCTLGIAYYHSKRRGGRRERKREEGGGLWPVQRIKLNKFDVKREGLKKRERKNMCKPYSQLFTQ